MGDLIAFESRKLLPHERLYSIYDKEMLAIMHALAKIPAVFGREQVQGED